MYSREELDEAGLLDFRNFLRITWDFLELPPPTPLQLSIAYYLQHGTNKRRVIQAFRGVGKSWITVAYVAWRLLLNPQIKIMVVSATDGLANDFTKFLKQLLNGMPVLQHLAPRRGQLDQHDKFDVGPALPSKDPSVKSVGINGQITGSRADVIVPDDVEIPRNAYTELMRANLAKAVKEFDAILKPDEDAEITYLGTPQTEQSLYRKLPERGYDVRVWPAEIPENTARYSGRLAPHILAMIQKGVPAGTPTDPVRFSREDLAKRKASYQAEYALQFMLDTSLSDLERHPLKLSNLLVADVDPEQAPIKMEWSTDPKHVLNSLPAGGFDGDPWRRPFWRSEERAKYSHTVMAVDPSGKGKDETAYAVVRGLHSTLFLVGSGGYTDGYAEETLKQLAATVVRYRVTTLLIEENYGGGMFTQLLTPVIYKACMDANVPVPRINPEEEWDGWSSGQKELRICNTLQPLFESHRLVVDQRVVELDALQQQEQEKYSLVYQITRLTRDRRSLSHDDRVEALSMACSFFTSMMNRDRDKMKERQVEEARRKELETFKKYVMQPRGGHQQQPLRWAGRRI